MILLCPQCHRSYIHADEEVAQRGGPSAFRCEECDGALESMEAVMGVSLTPHDETARFDDGRVSGSMSQLTEGTAPNLHPDATLADTENPVMDMLHPPGQMVVGQGFVSGSLEALPEAMAHNADTTRPVAAMNHGDATRTELHPLPARRAKEASEEGGKGLGMALGCGGALVLLLLLGAVGGGAWWFVNDKPAPDKPTPTPNVDKNGQLVAQTPTRPPIQDRLRQAVQSNSSATIPALALPSSPADGEVVLITTSGLIVDKKMVAPVSNQEISASVLPRADSPFVQPLASSLDEGFQAQQEDPDADTARWAVLLVDSKTEYRVLFPALFTSWERGANLQLATNNPSNPQAWLAVEIFPAQGWPDMDSVGIPPEFSHRDPERRPDRKLKTMVITIQNDGFTLRAPGEKPEEAEHIRRDTTWPINSLRNKYEELLQKHPDGIQAVRLEPHRRLRAFTLLQTISALLQPVQGEQPLQQVYLSAPTE